MKTSVVNLVIGFAILFAFESCQKQSQQESSVDIAERANDSTFTDREDEKDADFVVSTVARNYGDIKISQLAHNKSVDERIKAMATELQVTHTAFLKELKAYANANGMAVPLEEAEADSKSLSDLEEYTAHEFDKKWLSVMKDRHKTIARKMERKMDKTEDPALKEWISKSLPVIQSELKKFEGE